MKIKLIGHSSVLMEIGEQTIITDPYFSKTGNIAFKRTRPPYGERSQYVDSDLVLVSHNHFDHMDIKFFNMLTQKSKVVLPNVMKYMKSILGIKNAIGLRTYEKSTINGITITAVPAIHPAICCGYIIEAEGKCIYFSGDTYYGSFMKGLSEKYTIDIALIPVTTYRIPMTMSERSAIKAVKALNPKTIIPIHLGIEPRLPLMKTKDSVEEFTVRLRSAGITSEVIALLEGDEFLI
jgi:L-ascorbate metabolism protein UlaG (beta-lactamase superfamily)